MGADFVFVVASSITSEEEKDDLRARVKFLTDDEARKAWTDLFYDEGDDYSLSAIRDDLETALEYAIEAGDFDGTRRDVGHVFIEGKWYAISGGMTWGDDPTDAYRHLDHLNFFYGMEDTIGR